MIVTMNIEHCTTQKARLFAEKALYGVDFVARIEGVSYPGPEGYTVTDVLVCRFEVAHSWSVYAVFSAVNAFCAGLGEDCAAVDIDGSGYLIGPNADKWGDFNRDFFINF